MGTRTKVMKTTKNVTSYQNYLKSDSKNISSILILFHPMAEIDQLLANGSIV